MENYIEINEVNIPLKVTDDCFEWELALVIDGYAYYTQNEGYSDIALMYRIRFGQLYFVSNNYFAYESMMDDIEDVINKRKKALFMSGELVKELSKLGGEL